MNLSTVQLHTLETVYHLGVTSIRKMYEYINSNYPDIRLTYKEITQWLHNQPSYQINQAQPRKQQVNIKPIISNSRLSFIAIDLLDYSQISAPNSYKYLMNIIDIYSRKVWLYKLRQKEPKYTLEAFKQFINDVKEYTPNLKLKDIRILTDQGGEFQGDFHQFLKQHDIKHIISNTPQSNGICERSNQTIRRILDKYIKLNNVSNRWNVIDKIQDIYNSTYHRVIKSTPDNIFFSDNEQTKTDMININKERLNNAKAKIVNKNVLSSSNSILNTGQYVRLVINKKKNLLDKTKGFNNWTAMIYIIVRKIRNRNELLEDRYILKTYDNEPIKKTFYRSQLLPIPEPIILNLIEEHEKPIEKPIEKVTEKVTEKKPIELREKSTRVINKPIRYRE